MSVTAIVRLKARPGQRELLLAGEIDTLHYTLQSIDR